MAMTVADVARSVDGVLEGEGRAPVTGLNGLAEAGPSEMSFLANPRYTGAMATTRAAAVLVAADWEGESPCPVIRVKNPDLALATLAARLGPGPVEQAPGRHPTAVVASDACLGDDVRVGACAVIENGVRIGDRTWIGAGCYLGRATVIGADCRLYPHVSLRESTTLGDRVIIHNGAVIGSDGFGYARSERGWEKIPQIGIVEIGDDVEIGANAVVDRARFGKTVIGNGVKIDNLVQVAHNCRIGERAALAGQVGLAGSTMVGADVQMGGQSGATGHLEIGDRCVVGAKTGVTKSVRPGTFVSGYPAMPHAKAKRMHAHLMRLPELKKRVAALEKEVRDLLEAAGNEQAAGER